MGRDRAYCEHQAAIAFALVSRTWRRQLNAAGRRNSSRNAHTGATSATDCATRRRPCSGKHDQSILGVRSGDYDAAPVASDVFHRMAVRGQIKEDDFCVLWKSPEFPTSSFAYAHDLEPKLRDPMLKCFYDYRFNAEMQKAFDGADRFVPVKFLKDWAIVRQVAEAGGEKFNRAAYEKETAREAAAKKK